MQRPKYIRHLKIRTEKLRSIMHDMWVLGNESYNTATEPAGEAERRQAVLDRLVSEGYATLTE